MISAPRLMDGSTKRVWFINLSTRCRCRNVSILLFRKLIIHIYKSFFKMPVNRCRTSIFCSTSTFIEWYSFILNLVCLVFAFLFYFIEDTSENSQKALGVYFEKLSKCNNRKALHPILNLAFVHFITVKLLNLSGLIVLTIMLTITPTSRGH